MGVFATQWGFWGLSEGGRGLQMVAHLLGAGTGEPGDLVPAPGGEAEVLRIVRRDCSEWFEVHCGGVMAIKATRAHVLYRATGEAVAIEDVRLGDWLATAGDHVEVTGLALDRSCASLVGLELAEPHLHFAGPLSLLCHNGTAKP